MKNKFLLIALALISCNDNNSKNDVAKKSSVSFENEIIKYKNGNIMRIGTQRVTKNEKDSVTALIGQWSYYYPNGKIKQIKNFNDKGNLTGQLLDYYENGKIYFIDNYDNGKLIEEKGYSLEGTLTDRFIKENEDVTLNQTFYSNGGIQSETVTRFEMEPDDDDEHSGIDTTTYTYEKKYYLSGVLYERTESLNGKDSKYSVWGENGNLVLDTLYK